MTISQEMPICRLRQWCRSGLLTECVPASPFHGGRLCFHDGVSSFHTCVLLTNGSGHGRKDSCLRLSMYFLQRLMREMNRAAPVPFGRQLERPFSAQAIDDEKHLIPGQIRTFDDNFTKDCAGRLHDDF